MHLDTLSLDVAGVAICVAYMQRTGSAPPLVCLHGFGSTKEDYGDLALRPDWADRPLLLIDAPGFGGSTVADPDRLSILFHAQAALAVCDALGLHRFHLSGHSMGGAAGLLLARAQPDRVLSFINIEGNLAPEDCFLSRQVLLHPADTAEAFFEGFQARVRLAQGYGSALYAAGLPGKVAPPSCAPVFRSLVALSDEEPLLDWFAHLPCPRLFVYGVQNRHLTYIDRLPGMGVTVAEIPDAGHFPMYTNPPALWDRMASFLAQAEAG